ncbi:hypothetical protein DFH06DRAFT_610060 [Mycena polygramma]|nr:hypothetical protein DFH06DRAFT_610060 [Mycena polygramma]
MRQFLHRNLHSSEYTVWIRRSTGRPCLDLTPANADARFLISFGTSCSKFRHSSEYTVWIRPSTGRPRLDPAPAEADSHFLISSETSSSEFQNPSAYTVWIRPSIGRPCAALTSAEDFNTSFGTGFERYSASLLKRPVDSQIISSVSLKDFNNICYSHLGGWRQIPLSTNIPVKLGSIRHFPSRKFEDSFEIAFVPGCRTSDGDWWTRDSTPMVGWNLVIRKEEGILKMENGWIRVNTADVADVYLRRIWVHESGDDRRILPGWLTQANHIFNCLNITCNFEDSMCIDTIEFWLKFSASTRNLPPGYLFFCPAADFESDLPKCFRIPDVPAYWSLDALGAQPLTTDEARALDFPLIEVKTEARVRSWDGDVYVGIRQFHEAMGFDAYSQQAASALGHQLIQMSCDRDDFLAHLKASSAGDDSSESESGEVYHNVPEREENISCSSTLYAEVIAPSRNWNVIMSVQFALLLILGLFSLYEAFCVT